MILAYIDLRPFIFLAGLPLFTLATVLICRLLRPHANVLKLFLIAPLIFTVAFILFLTGFGPFVGQESTQEHMMTWTIIPAPANRDLEPEILLTFEEYPEHSIGVFSNDLAEHLKTHSEERVKVVFAVTTDYGNVRGFNAVEIGGLTDWVSPNSYYQISGDANNGSDSSSPFD